MNLRDFKKMTVKIALRKALLLILQANETALFALAKTYFDQIIAEYMQQLDHFERALAEAMNDQVEDIVLYIKKKQS